MKQCLLLNSSEEKKVLTEVLQHLQGRAVPQWNDTHLAEEGSRVHLLASPAPGYQRAGAKKSISV